MTVKELPRLQNIQKAIKMYETKIDKLEREIQALGNFSSDVVSGSSIEAPYVKHSIVINGVAVKNKDKEDYYTKCKQLKTTKEALETAKERHFEVYNETMRFICEEVDDPLMEQILHLYCVDGLPWRQVAAGIGGNNTEESVRKQYTRFMERI